VIADKFTISPRHASLAGHFPGNPLVPGVVILDEVMSSIRRQIDNVEICSLPAVKFLSPLLPGNEVTVTLEKKQTALLDFTCHAADRLICSGQVRIHV